jgi:hypothetical protein
MSNQPPPLAHNTGRSGPKQDVPIIIEHPAHYPFADGEREREWHTASDDELIAYETFWNKVHDAGDDRDPGDRNWWEVTYTLDGEEESTQVIADNDHDARCHAQLKFGSPIEITNVEKI